MTSTQYETITLEHPWGSTEEQVRIFPPCQIKDSFHEGPMVTIFALRHKTWKRETVRDYGFFPRGGFIAWDDKNEEYAWHDIGTIHIPKAKDPDLPKSTPNTISHTIIRGETEPVVAGAGTPRRPRTSQRGRFMRWWASLSSSSQTPDFLRKES